MRILLTNDDGIHAEGIAVAERIARAFDPDADIWVVAPTSEMSGVAHCISYTKPVRLEDHGPQRFAADGFPADCVLIALFEIMKDAPPDLILSGVNRGNNVSENTMYSGTVGAAIEAAMHGVKTIAMSQFYGPGNTSLENTFEAAETHGPGIIRHLLEKGEWGGTYDLFYNVNFPPCPAADVTGPKATFQGRRRESHFSAQPYDAPNRRRYFWIHGGPQHIPSSEGADATANLENAIAVTPCRADLTAHDVIPTLAKTFE